MSWPIVPFADVLEDVTGGNEKTKQSEYAANGAYPIVDQGQSLIGGYTDDANSLCKTNAPVIIFGDHTKALKYVDFPFCLGADGTKVLKPRHNSDTKYLYYALHNIHIPDAGYSRHFKYLKAGKIPLPPLEEQKRIAGILDQADALRRLRTRALDKLNTLGQAIFHEMFGAANGPPVSVRGALPVLPEGWAWEKLLDVAKLTTGHTPDRKVADYWDGGVSWISLKEIREFDGMEISKTDLQISEAGLRNSSAVRHPKDTVCLSRTASVGFVTIMKEEMATSQDFVNWICGPKLNPRYLMQALIASRKELKSLATGSTHRTIYLPIAKQFKVLVPPIELQDMLVERIKVVEKKKCVARRLAAKQNSLFAALQHRAFRGEL